MLFMFNESVQCYISVGSVSALDLLELVLACRTYKLKAGGKL